MYFTSVNKYQEISGLVEPDGAVWDPGIWASDVEPGLGGSHLREGLQEAYVWRGSSWVGGISQ